MSIKQTTKGYLVDIQAKGYRRVRKVMQSEPEAILLEAQIRAAISRSKSQPYVDGLLAGENSVKGIRISSKGSTLDTLYDSIVNLYDGTKNEYKAISTTRLVIDAIGKDIPVENINSSIIQGVISKFKQQGNSTGTLNRKMSALSKMLNLAYDQGLIQDIPKIPRFKESKGRVVYYTDSMLNDFFELCKEQSPDLVFIFEFLLDTGCRIGEALKLEPSDFNGKQSVTFRDTKNGTSRTVPLTKRLQGNFQYPLTTHCYDYIRKQFDAMRETLGWSDKYVIHTFRHTCATRLVQKGVNLPSVSQWMGHRDIKTTMIYIQFSPDHLKDAVDKLQS